MASNRLNMSLFGASGTYLISNGPATTPTFQSANVGPNTFPYSTFTDPTLTTFSWVNQAAASVATNTYNGVNVITLSGASASNNVSARVTTYTTPPYTCTLCLTSPLSFGGAAIVGMCLYDSGSAKSIIFGYTNGIGNLVVFSYATVTSADNAVFVSFENPNLYEISYLRISDNATTRTYSMSIDGIYFRPFFSELTNTFLTPTDIGVAINSTNTGQTCVINYSSFTVTSP